MQILNRSQGIGLDRHAFCVLFSQNSPYGQPAGLLTQLPGPVAVYLDMRRPPAGQLCRVVCVRYGHPAPTDRRRPPAAPAAASGSTAGTGEHEGGYPGDAGE